MTQSVYERIGGEAAVNAAVDIFYRKVLKDPRINMFFKDVDMDRQAAKQKAFLTVALGGPNKYTGKDMRAGHARLVARGLNDALIAGLRTALFLLEEGNGISPERKQQYISSLRLMLFLGEEGSRSD